MRRILATAAFIVLLGLTVPAAGDLDEPFGRPTVEAGSGPLRVIWRQMQDKLQAENDVVSRCQAAPSSCASPAAEQFLAIVREGDGHDDVGRIGRINRAVNFAISRARAGAAPTEWTSPLETLMVGAGDCKQYAVLKYAALLGAGMAADRVRLVIVRIKPPTPQTSMSTSHAVVAARVQSRWLVLDSRSLTVSESTGLLDDMEPLFTLDSRGVRQYVLPPSTPMVPALCGDNRD